VDYGIMAATFLNLDTGKAFRVVSTEEARDLAAVYAPEASGKSQQQLTAYCRMPDSVLFRVQQVRVPIKPVDLPGPTQCKVTCCKCGQVVRDGREAVQEGLYLLAVRGGRLFFKRSRNHLGGHELGAR
jgi:formylmethanofuran dehydrogenase subunit E